VEVGGSDDGDSDVEGVEQDILNEGFLEGHSVCTESNEIEANVSDSEDNGTLGSPGEGWLPTPPDYWSPTKSKMIRYIGMHWTTLGVGPLLSTDPRSLQRVVLDHKLVIFYQMIASLYQLIPNDCWEADSQWLGISL
jgi:hypothetical protein